MANRITEKDLESLATVINQLTNSPTMPYMNGKAAVGNFHISHAYGGVSLHRMTNLGGGVSEPLSTGHLPKRELFYRMSAFIDGLRFAQANICDTAD
jgi:hypothetical protein